MVNLGWMKVTADDYRTTGQITPLMILDVQESER